MQPRNVQILILGRDNSRRNANADASAWMRMLDGLVPPGLLTRNDVSMVFRMLLFAWSCLLDLAAVSRPTDSEKDLEILLLRQELRIVERKQQPAWVQV